MATLILSAVAGCVDSASTRGSQEDRVFERRAYDGAPPVTPHPEIEGQCTTCHSEDGRPRTVVADLGVAPRSPHGVSSGVGPNCEQCHAPARTSELFVRTTFRGLEPAAMKTSEPTDPPPVIPHRVLMRENCTACHSGPDAPEVLAMDHPERVNCRQCHAAGNRTSPGFPASTGESP